MAGALAAELRREYEAIFDEAIDDTERQRRQEAWVAKLLAAWPDLTPDEQWEMADRRSTLHLLGM